MHVFSVTPYAEKIIRWISLPYWLSLVLIWEGIFLADYFLGMYVADGHDHLLEHGLLTFFFAMVSVATVYCSKVLVKLYNDLQLFIEHDADELLSWYKQKLQRSYEGWVSLLFALCFTLVVNVTIGETIRQFTSEATVLYYFRLTYEYVGFFFLGLGIWALVNVAFLTINLTKFKIRVSLNQISGRGLQALGSAYFKMSLAIVLTFVPLVMAAIVSPLINDFSILIWMGIGTITIFGFFLIPQIGIHNIMAHEKQQRLFSFASHLEDSLERSLKDPTSENLQHLKELFELQAHLKGINDWPFNVSTLWQLITALLIPVSLALMEVYFNK